MASRTCPPLDDTCHFFNLFICRKCKNYVGEEADWTSECGSQLCRHIPCPRNYDEHGDERRDRREAWGFCVRHPREDCDNCDEEDIKCKFNLGERKCDNCHEEEMESGEEVDCE